MRLHASIMKVCDRKWASGVGTHKLFKFIETGDLSKFLRVHRMYRYAVFGRLRNLKSGAAPHPFRGGAPILKVPRGGRGRE